MNFVDSLILKPFSTCSLPEKLEIKRLGPHQPSDFYLQTSDKKQVRKFSSNWFIKKKWLTVSEHKNSLFCFYCLLFGGDAAWTVTGFRDMKHLSERIKKHETSSRHLQNALDFQTFGSTNIMSQMSTGYAAYLRKHNDSVKRNRHVLNRLIDILKFCGGHNLSLRGHDEKEVSCNRGVFLDMVTYTRQIDVVLDDYLNKNPVAQYTSKTIQNELLECVFKVYLKELESEIDAANFISFQADETTDVSCTSQMVCVLRFVKDKVPVERFLSFIDLHDRSAQGMVDVIINLLNKYNLVNKLISQTYDGAAVMSGGKSGVQSLMKNHFPFALFVHCYAHQLNLVLKQASSSIKEVRIFFANVSAFSSFFSSSPKRKDVLLEVCERRGLPRTMETRWNFQSRVVQSIFESKEHLKHCFELIQCEPWDATTICEATGLLNNLNDVNFNFFLELFNKIFWHVDILYNILQARNTTGIVANMALTSFYDSINIIRNNFNFSDNKQAESSTKRIRTSMHALNIIGKEVCDIIISQVQARFETFEVICAFNIVNPGEFLSFASEFPLAKMQIIVKHFSFFDADALKNELSVIYSNKMFQNMSSLIEFFGFLRDNNLCSTFEQTSKLVEIVLATPVTTVESERCFSTLKNIKSYKSSTMGQSRLNSLAVLSICKEVILDIQNFNEKVIDLFAQQKERRADFLYK